jgi:hypothetical protein
MALEVVGHAALLSIIFGVFEESASALYLTFLVARVFQGALLFLRFFEFVFTRKST